MILYGDRSHFVSGREGGRMRRLGDKTLGYLQAYRSRFPDAGELARYVSSALRGLNAPSVVADVMAQMLEERIREREADDYRPLTHEEAQRLFILHDPAALERLYALYEEVLGHGFWKERWEAFLGRLFERVQMVPDDWTPPVTQRDWAFAVGVGSRAASMFRLSPSPPGLRMSHLEVIRHLFFISYAVLSRSFETHFPVATQARTHHRRSR